ncbi:MAG TPA: ABC transporter permease [Candidatus Dormibacteraeota bacterium]|nr:ABC transporter permease [Candidatus Dormibacteraeota bacterium]
MRGLRGMLLRRLATLLPTAVVGTMVVFSLDQLTPGGAAEAAAGPNATPQQIATLRHEMGLDKPLPVQYGTWLAGLFHGDFGRSLLNRQDVGAEITQRLPVTIELTVAALVVALVVGIPLGILSASRRRSRLDGTILGVSGLGLAIPEFLLAMLAVDIVCLKLGWLPPTGWTPISQGLGANLQTLVLPALTLGSGAAAVITRQTRGAMVEVLDSPFIRTAWALGLPQRQIYFRFALRNALISVITVVGLIAAALLGAAVLIERVFVLPGMGSMLVDAVTQKDFPVTQGVTVVFIAIVILINLLVDISYAILDPRIRS